MNENRKQLNEKIKNEFEQFKTKTLELDKEEIFKIAYDIDFKNYLLNYLTDSETYIPENTINALLKEDDVLDLLFKIYNMSDESNYYEDACDFVLEEYETIYMEDMEQA